MRTRAFWSLLARNRFQLHFLGIGMTAAISQISLWNSFLYRLQQLKHGKGIEETKLSSPPVFVIGHWRSGTTLLHEYLALDSQFAYPTTYECFVPSHFVISEKVLPKYLGWVLPKKRPMDNMSAGFDLPQEDEFALCALGAPTPYLRMAFPNRGTPYLELLDLEGVADSDLEAFKGALDWFVKALTYYHQKQLILKSPPHTGRIHLLKEMFPGAKFVHIARDPREIFSSTVKLWKSLDRAQAFQIPGYSEEFIQEYVFTCFERMYTSYLKHREELPESDLYELKYEDLVAQPEQKLREIYNHFGFSGFDDYLPKLQKSLQDRKSYQRNQHNLSPELAAQIEKRWEFFLREFGY